MLILSNFVPPLENSTTHIAIRHTELLLWKTTLDETKWRLPKFVCWFYAKNLIKHRFNECASIKTRLRKYDRLNCQYQGLSTYLVYTKLKKESRQQQNYHIRRLLSNDGWRSLKKTYKIFTWLKICQWLYVEWQFWPQYHQKHLELKWFF